MGKQGFGRFRLNRCALVIGVFVSMGQQGGASAVTLDGELASLLQEHPRIVAARQATGAAGYEMEQAHDNYLPVLNIAAEGGPDRYEHPIRTFGEERSLNRDQLYVELKQNLYRGGRDQALVAEARAKEAEAGHTLSLTQQEILNQGIGAYLDVLCYAHMLKLANDKLSVAHDYQSLIERGRRSGSATEVEVLEASLALQRAQEEFLGIDVKARAAVSRYTALFAHSPASGEMHETTLPLLLLPQDLASALAMADERNAQLAVAAQKVEQARADIKQSKGEYMPTLDLVGRYTRETNAEGYAGTSYDRTVMLQMSWQYNLGNQVGAAVGAATQRMASHRAELDVTRREIEQKVRLAWDRYNNEKKRHRIASETVPMSQRALEARNQLRQRGKGGEEEILNARAHVLASQFNEINARYEVLKAGYELGLLTGALNPQSLGL